MKTTPTLTLLLEVQAAFERIAYESSMFLMYEKGAVSCGKISRIATDIAPSIQELVRRAGEVDAEELNWEATKFDYAQPDSDVDLGNLYYWANLWHDKYKAAIRPHLTPVASGWMPIESCPTDGSDFIGRRKVKGQWFYEIVRYNKFSPERVYGELGTMEEWHEIPQPPKKD